MIFKNRFLVLNQRGRHSTCPAWSVEEESINVHRFVQTTVHLARINPFSMDTCVAKEKC